MLGLCYWVGVNEKVQITREPVPNVFLGVGLIVFPAIFSSNFKPPSPSYGLCFFLNIELTQTCIAIDVPSFPPPDNQEYDKEIHN